MRVMLILVLLILIGLVGFLASWDMPAPSAPVEKVIPNDRFTD